MSLKAILAMLGSGEIGSVVNVVQAVVHACIEEFEHLRGECDQSKSACTEMMNRAEERVRDLVGAAVMDLVKRGEAVEVARADGVAGLEGTVRRHVERLEGRLAALEASRTSAGELEGYDGEPTE